MILCILNQRSPGLEETGPVLIHRFRPVPADEPGDDIESEQRRCLDDLFQMAHGSPSNFRVRIQRIRVVTERTNLNTMIFTLPQNFLRMGFRESDDVNLSHACIFPLRLAHRPTHDLHGGKALVCCEVQNIWKGKIREDGGNKTEFHNFGLEEKIKSRPTCGYCCFSKSRHRVSSHNGHLRPSRTEAAFSFRWRCVHRRLGSAFCDCRGSPRDVLQDCP